MYNKRKTTMLNEPRLLKFILFFILAILFFGFVVMSLWNAILFPVLHVQTINFVQALGILILSKILFGGLSGRRWGGRRPFGGMQEKLANMSPEEREKFKTEWRNRCNRWGHKEDTPQAPAE